MNVVMDIFAGIGIATVVFGLTYAVLYVRSYLKRSMEWRTAIDRWLKTPHWTDNYSGAAKIRYEDGWVNPNDVK